MYVIIVQPLREKVPISGIRVNGWDLNTVTNLIKLKGSWPIYVCDDTITAEKVVKDLQSVKGVYFLASRPVLSTQRFGFNLEMSVNAEVHNMFDPKYKHLRKKRS